MAQLGKDLLHKQEALNPYPEHPVKSGMMCTLVSPVLAWRQRQEDPGTH